MKSEILSEWALSVEEISNNVYKVTLKDKFGRIAEAVDSDLDRAVETVQKYAIKIQKEISRNK